MTVTYLYPLGATATTPPTAAQMQLANALTVLVNTLDADTAGVITHNWGLLPGETANYWPIPTVAPTVRETAGDFVTWGLPETSPNALTFGKTSGAGTGGTFAITLLRPHTLIR